MNVLLASRYDELVHRLALGIEPFDALTGRARSPRRCDVTIESPATRLARGAAARSSGTPSGRCRAALRRVGRPPVVVRIVDPSRRYVPRRLAFPIVRRGHDAPRSSATATPAAARRARRPCSSPARPTRCAARRPALRGRVHPRGAPLRWARVEARADGSAAPWRAHGDDRGEFLLVHRARRRQPRRAASPLDVTRDGASARTRARGPPAAAPGPLWDLPLEIAPAPGRRDDVSAGATLPAGYAPGRRTPRRRPSARTGHVRPRRRSTSPP